MLKLSYLVVSRFCGLGMLLSGSVCPSKATIWNKWIRSAPCLTWSLVGPFVGMRSFCRWANPQCCMEYRDSIEYILVCQNGPPAFRGRGEKGLAQMHSEMCQRLPAFQVRNVIKPAKWGAVPILAGILESQLVLGQSSCNVVIFNCRDYSCRGSLPGRHEPFN